MWRGFCDLLDVILTVTVWVVRRAWRFRAGLVPVWTAAAVAVGGAMLPPRWWWTPVTAALMVAPGLFWLGDRLSDPVQRVVAWLVPDMLDSGRKGVLDRETERGYLALLLLACGGWVSWIADRGWPESPWWFLSFFAAMSAPWIWHRGWRRRRRPNRWAMRWKYVADAIKEFESSRVITHTGNGRVTVLRVRLRAGMTVRHVADRHTQVASALSPRLRAGAVTLSSGPSARDVMVRIVPRNPWRGALIHPLPEVGSWEIANTPRRVVGQYEDATDDVMKLGQHMMVVGQTGSGKSVWLESLLAWLLTARDTAVVAADLASGATFGVWDGVFAAPLATEARDAAALLGRVFALIEYREGLLSRRKKAGDLADVLPPSPDMPWLWVIIDEFPDLIKAAKSSTPPLDVITVLERLANKGRKVGVWLVLGAQNPTAHDVGSTELRGALTGVVGLGLSEQQSKTLWGTGRQEGWDSRPLTTGTYLLQDRDAVHQTPRVAKGLYVPPAERLALIRAVSRQPMRLDTASQRYLDGHEVADALGDTARAGKFEVITTVPQLSPSDELDARVLEELPDQHQGGVGASPIADQLGVSRDKVNRSLRRLRATGRVEQAGHGQWVRAGD